MGEPVVDISFHPGIDEGTRDEFISPGAGFPVLQNARQDKVGGLSKRPGFGALSRARIDGADIGSALRMITKGEQVAVVDAEGILYGRSSTLNAYVERGRLPEATYSFLDVPSIGIAGNVNDIIECNGYVAVSWLVVNDYSVGATVSHYVAIVDPVDGTFVRSPEVVDTGVVAYTSLAKVGNSIFAVTADSGASNIRVSALDTSSASSIYSGWGAPVIVSTDFKWAHSVSVLSDRVAIAYVNDGVADVTSRVTVMTVDAAMATSSVRINTSSVVPDAGGVGTSEGGSVLWVAWNEGVVIKVNGFDPSLVAVSTTSLSVIDITPLLSSHIRRLFVCPREDGTTGKAVVIVEVNSVGIQMIGFKVSGGTLSLDGQLGISYGIGIAGRPFVRNGQTYAHFYRVESSGATDVDDMFALCAFDSNDITVTNTVPPLRPVAAPVVRGLFSTDPTRMRCRTVAVDDSTYLFGFSSPMTGVSIGTRLVEYGFSSPYRWRSEQLGNVVHVAGGVHSIYDGSSVFEANFLLPPIQVQTSIGGGGGLTFTNGGRRYVAVYEHVDATGARHISGVSMPSSMCGNAGPGATVELSTNPLSMTSRVGTRVVFYATKDGGEEPYYRLTGANGEPSAITVTSGFINFTDNVQDAVLASHELLYETGALPGTGAGQDHRAPPGLSCIASYNGMIVGASGKTLWYSASPVSGEGEYFSPVFTADVPSDVTALASQDGVLYAFCAQSIYSLSGDAPSDNGLVGGLGAPARLATNSGCINPNSVVVTSLGIFFQSARGIELLARGGSVSFIGMNVQETLVGREITSAVLDDRNWLVRFSLSDARVSGFAVTGLDLVFDIELEHWQSVDIKYGSRAGAASQDAAMVTVNGTRSYGWLDNAGAVYFERVADDINRYFDSGTWITMKAETPWVHLSGLQGEQIIEKFLFLAEKRTDHGLTVTAYRDYLDSYSQVVTYTSDQIAALPKEWIDAALDSSRGQAIKFVIEDAPPPGVYATGGDGATWIGLTLVGQPGRGPRRTSGAERGS